MRSKALTLLSLCSTTLFAAGTENPANTDSYLSNPVFLTLLGLIAMLTIVILSLSSAVNSAAQRFNEKKKTGKQLTAIAVLLLAGTSMARAQETVQPPVAHDPNWWGIDPVTFWLLITLILFQVFTIYTLRLQLFFLLGIEKHTEEEALAQPSLIERLNASIAVEKEEEIMFDHEYDGIRELDNALPPWWKYGFYVTVVFALGYLLNYHVFETGDLQLDEYKKELAAADLQLQEYRKKAANLVDETNVKLLTDAGSIAAGRELFTANCTACHGVNGEGKVGPNLTDEYWLHKGSVKDIFKTIKFGYPEKGMKSWKDDFSPSQIANIASFVMSLKGSHPANAKEHQGELYIMEGDSTKMPESHKDSLSVRDTTLSEPKK